MPTGKITKETVDAIPIPAKGKRELLWDPTLKGFGVQVTDKGSRSYLVQYRMGGRETPSRRFTIGTHGSPWTPKTARDRAIEILNEVQRGIDPRESQIQKLEERAAAKRKQETETAVAEKLEFSKMAARYVADCQKRDMRTWKAIKSTIKLDLIDRFKSMALTEIGSDDVMELLEEIGERSVSAKRRAYGALNGIFNFAAMKENKLFKLGNSPMLSVPSPGQGGTRTRTLADDEIRVVWKASQQIGWPFGSIYQLLLLTGARSREVAGARWSEFDLTNARWNIPGGRTKNKSDHWIDLSPKAVEILQSLLQLENDSDLVFTTTGSTPVSGFSKARIKLDTAINDILASEALASGKHWAPLPHWVPHDFRRTIAANCQKLRVELQVVEEILNHKAGTRAGIVGVYQTYKFESERREAILLWGERLQNIIDGEGN